MLFSCVTYSGVPWASLAASYGRDRDGGMQLPAVAIEAEAARWRAQARDSDFWKSFCQSGCALARQQIATMCATVSQDILIGSRSGFTHLAPRAVHVSIQYKYKYKIYL